MAHRVFEAVPDAARRVRAFVLTTLAATGCSDHAVEDAMLCASELATIALTTGGDQFAVEVWGDKIVHVGISVSDPAHLDRILGSDTTTLWSRRLLDAATEEWGYVCDDEGESMWFDIAC